MFSASDLAELLDAGKGPVGTADFLVVHADRIVWRINDTVEQCEDLVADLEKQVMDESSGSFGSIWQPCVDRQFHYAVTWHPSVRPLPN